MNERNGLAERLEIIGEIFEIDGVAPLMAKFEKGQSIMHMNAVVIQIISVLLKSNKGTADKLVAMSNGITVEDVNGLSDKDYSVSLRDAITVEVLGFFG